MKQFAIRLISMLIGLLLYGFGIVLTINANIGYGPWEVFHAGLAKQTGLSIGVTSIIAGVVILIAVTLCKEKLGLGTVASMVLTGVFIDLIMLTKCVPMPSHIAAKILMLVAGLFIIAMGSYFYMKSGFGAGPRDNLMVVLNRKTKLPIGFCRGIVELAVTLVGWLLGGMIGIGTLVSGFAIGFCVQAIFALFRFNAAAVQHETLRQTFSRLKSQVKRHET